MWKLAAIGECMLELSNPAGHAFERNMPMQFSYGGDTLNTAVYLSRLGVSCSYITALGDDAYSDWLLAEWQQEGIQTQSVEILPGRVPGLYMIQTDDQGERSFHYWRQQAPVRDLFSDEQRVDRVFAALAQCDEVYLSGITLSLFTEDARNTLLEGLRGFQQQGGRVAFDGNYRPAGWVSAHHAMQAFKEIYSITAIALPTFDDEQQLFGDSRPEDTARRLHDYGIAEVVVKHNAEGAYISSADKDNKTAAQWIGTRPVDQVVDSTAAGDSFNAAYLAARAIGRPSSEAAAAGNALAACVIQHPGAIISREAMPSGAIPPIDARIGS